MIYSIQSNWFQDYIRPRAIRRAVGAFVVSAAVLWSSIILNSKLAMAIAFIAFLFGLYDVVSLKSTKSMVESLKIAVSTEGLTLILESKNIKALYPWRSLVVSRIRRKGDVVMSFVVEDNSRKRSRVSVMGYQNITGLFAEIQEKVGNA
jgi:hypothetical protein